VGFGGAPVGSAAHDRHIVSNDEQAHWLSARDAASSAPRESTLGLRFELTLSL
jgi:hypothetical protein